MNFDKLTDKERIEFALGSIKLINHYLRGVNEEKFENDMKTQDAIQYRMSCIGNAINAVSEKLRERYDILWGLYVVLNIDSAELMFQLKQKDKETNEPYESLKSLFNILYDVYRHEYSDVLDSEKKSYVEDYDYPIKTKNSIWTVKNK
ncbi:hypothetical protein SAMN05444377_103169 [Flavobacterium fontis]|uniref:Uncharacterized protein n=1 Tax=Flavobacterium fontis TaxID=1124188 RepID=A0A1M4YNU4_9FLAO|nr:HepT-like ribonuclease domain-containing protein [Flavobacterium fontis]SHF07323.1 hypothetical protein SAMN05444377_103169 [Flavobacterium fontis]